MLKGIIQTDDGRTGASSQIIGRNSIDGNAVIGPVAVREDGKYCMPVFIATEDGPACIRINLGTASHEEAVAARATWLEEAKKGAFGLSGIIYSATTKRDTATACNKLWPCPYFAEAVEQAFHAQSPDLLQ